METPLAAFFNSPKKEIQKARYEWKRTYHSFRGRAR